jgi:hypothetical protein
MDYVARSKSGRCWNGASRDAGIIRHAVPAGEICGDDFRKALCGAVPGARGNGWGSHADPVEDVNCPRCLKRLSAVTP